jgi:hypothetical protein
VGHRILAHPARASAERTKANRAYTEAIVIRTLDSVSFNAWFTAFTAGNINDERLAENRMRPGIARPLTRGLQCMRDRIEGRR